jgi:hypothetical protein
MSTRTPVLAPDVVWESDEDELVDDPAALVLQAQILQLVQALWQRLPSEVQVIIAGDLRRVELVQDGSDEGITYGHHDEELVLFLPEEPPVMHAAFEDWRPALSWVIVCGFGRAFLWALLTRLCGANPVRHKVSPEAKVLPGWECLITLAAGQFGEPSVRALINRMIEGLVLAWGFGAELATVLEGECCCRAEGHEDWGLEPDLRRIARALEASGA